MNAPLTQKDRRARLSTALGKDALVFLRLDGGEEMSGDFEWRVDALSRDYEINLDDILGTHATVTIDTGHGPRHYDGIVTEAQRLRAEENGCRYSLVLSPWTHIAALRRNQRIFHNLSVVQILEELFGEYADLGGPHYEINLSGNYPKLEYTVQYGESDTDFAKRMMERFGISWHWVHQDGNHVMVLTDFASNHVDVPASERPYFGVERTHLGDEEHFRQWHGGSRVATGAVRLTEYNFKTPHAAQETERLGDAQYAQGQIESFDWPGDYLDLDAGETVVGRRIEEEQGHTSRVVAEGNVASLAAGLCVTPVGDKIPGTTGKRFVCLSARHKLRAQAYGTINKESDEPDYDGAYVLIPDSEPFRPERRTHMPRIYGPQTATVVGDGEIDCDEYGRILVQFHWDLHAAHSMRCRVSQNWASKGWGGMVIPRIGMEVVVEFLEGDPDKPLVTGCVYNGHNMPPYTLPDFKARSTFKSDTHTGDGYNEFRFEDENGEEEVYLQAERYLNAFIKDNETWLTEGSRHRRTDGSQSQSIGGDDDFELTGSQQIDIKGSQNTTIKGSRVEEVTISEMTKISRDRMHEVEGADDLFVHETRRVETKDGQHVKTGTNHFLDVGQDLSIEAGASISLYVGGNFVKIDMTGVTINGTLTKINSGGSPKKGKKINRRKPIKPKKYAGPHATRYGRSFES
ncbi:type VI secretion system tip protein TssI/VgrG [uncultured Tateyamaria sp.]|uniref:type VI secretion system Vgr family protein n=1 Tax=Tateyamaria sp. 1078 TaxID=3417464 RepID=UPI0026051D50|nr:type VI secretion system tip protein TssI/VgrG [uncultured Tateyamaria sp.]